ncbi:MULTISPECIES: hypothetical protein [unclassified Streptomyces]|uniref:hypothetical protein n=1 Tax=unclassified Streptomyces TaxID=2593676 RepID=UPI00340D57BA
MRASRASLCLRRSCRRTALAALVVLGAAALVPGLGRTPLDVSPRSATVATSAVPAQEEDFTWPTPPNPVPGAASVHA